MTVAALVVVAALALGGAPGARPHRVSSPSSPTTAPTTSLAPSGFVPPSVGEVDARVRAPWRGDINARLVDVTDAFVGAPYRLSALGEGEGTDPDPRLRFDAFDCTTFVETALALALATDLDDARRVLDRIRYRDDVVSFAERRHFPEAEWIPGLTGAGLLEDVTRAVGGDDVAVETKRLDAQVWARARAHGLPALSSERIPSGTFALDVWRLPAAAAHPERIPPGTILYVVRVDYRSVPVRVSHQGLVVEQDGRRFVRHAADRGHHRVVDEPIERFFARLQHYAKWPVAGVHLTRVQPAPDWRARLGVTPSPSPSSSPSSPSSSYAPSSAP